MLYQHIFYYEHTFHRFVDIYMELCISNPFFLPSTVYVFLWFLLFLLLLLLYVFKPLFSPPFKIQTNSHFISLLQPMCTLALCPKANASLTSTLPGTSKHNYNLTTHPFRARNFPCHCIFNYLGDPGPGLNHAFSPHC